MTEQTTHHAGHYYYDTAFILRSSVCRAFYLNHCLLYRIADFIRGFHYSISARLNYACMTKTRMKMKTRAVAPAVSACTIRSPFVGLSLLVSLCDVLRGTPTQQYDKQDTKPTIRQGRLICVVSVISAAGRQKAACGGR